MRFCFCRAQESCESRGGCPWLSAMVSVAVKQHWTEHDVIRARVKVGVAVPDCQLWSLWPWSNTELNTMLSELVWKSGWLSLIVSYGLCGREATLNWTRCFQSSCESRGGCPWLSVMVSVAVKQHWTEHDVFRARVKVGVAVPDCQLWSLWPWSNTELNTMFSELVWKSGWLSLIVSYGLCGREATLNWTRCFQSSLGSRVKVGVAVLGSPSLTVLNKLWSLWT